MASRTAPSISVLIPVHNRFEWLGAALASVCRQSVTDVEIIIADSSTVDGVGAYVTDLARSDPRIRVVTSETPLSAPEGRNLALAEARAPLIALLDSDDVMRPGRLAIQAEVMHRNPDVLLVAGKFGEVDEWGIPLAPDPPRERPRLPVRDLTARWILPFTSPLGPTFMIRATDIRAIGGFNAERPLCDDYCAAWQLSERGPIRMLPQTLTDWRRHPRQSSTIHGNRGLTEVYLMSARIVYSRIGRWLGPAVPGLGPEARTDAPVDHESLVRELLDHALSTWSPDADERRDLEEECERRIDMARRWKADPLDNAAVLDRDALPAQWMTRGSRET
ncbi:MAG: glycosyltransferase family A protein [Actinomycetes bacterium]